MFAFLKKLFARRRERKLEQNKACDGFISRLHYLQEEEPKLFADVWVEVAKEKTAQWQEYADAIIAELSTVQLRDLRRAKNIRQLKAECKAFRALRSTHNQRVQQHNQLVMDNHICDRYNGVFDDLFQQLAQLFRDTLEFVDPEEGSKWATKADSLQNEWRTLPTERMCKTVGFGNMKKKLQFVAENQRDIQNLVRRHNNQVAENRAQAAYALIGDVEGRKLDNQQLNCIVKKAHNHLVIAGAGTGKTTTVIGKIKYLLKANECGPEDILVLSFTNASAAEMKQRIHTETREQIEASTFHKLGLNIITKVKGVPPKITRLNLRRFIQTQLREHMRSDAYLQVLCRYFLTDKVKARSEFEFSSKAEYDAYLKDNPPKTLKGEAVKSYGEMDIANLLAYNGVAYCYEHPYEKDTRTEEYAQYYPDFYLPEHKIYIEYFGINRNGEVPAFFTGKGDKTPAQSYRDSMEWRRRLHTDNETIMIECFAYERHEGTLEQNLLRQLEHHGVVLHPKSPQELWKQVSEDGEAVLDVLEELFETIINLLKSNEYDIEFLRRANMDKRQQIGFVEMLERESNNDLLTLLEPIFHDYQAYLQKHDEIDFNDMINLAARYVAQGQYRNPYRYVIVDEYQDISKARYRLLKALRDSSDYELFCVGDDWQSIYRFAGSDIGYILNFAKYWGPSEESKIETTYRFTQSLIDISGRFIMKNPAQKQKAIRGKQATGGFALAEVNGYTEKYAIEFMAQKLEDMPKDSTVFFLGRYSFDKKMLEESDLFSLNYNNQTEFLEVQYRNRPDLKMSFLTAHKAKGLQADYVVILNNKDTRMGFPSTIQDAPILNLLLEKSDDYPYGEERRLFYVALTRAKKKVILLTVKDKESVFAKELKERYGEELTKERFSCPLCGGKLIRRTGRFGEFFGCSNYKTGQCKYTRNIRWKNSE